MPQRTGRARPRARSRSGRARTPRQGTWRPRCAPKAGTSGTGRPADRSGGEHARERRVAAPVDQLPAPGHRQGVGVGGAQVVGHRVALARQGVEPRRALGVVVGERRGGGVACSRDERRRGTWRHKLARTPRRSVRMVPDDRTPRPRPYPVSHEPAVSAAAPAAPAAGALARVRLRSWLGVGLGRWPADAPVGHLGARRRPGLAAPPHEPRLERRHATRSPTPTCARRWRPTRSTRSPGPTTTARSPASSPTAPSSARTARSSRPRTTWRCSASTTSRSSSRTRSRSIFEALLPLLIPVVLFVGIFWLLQRRAQSQMGGIMSIGRSQGQDVLDRAAGHDVRRRRRLRRRQAGDHRGRRLPEAPRAVRRDRRPHPQGRAAGRPARAPARRSSPGPSPARPACRSCRSPAPTSWRCSSASAPAASATCSRTPASWAGPSSSSTRSTRSAASAAPASAAATTSASRRSTRCCPRWTASRPPRAS